MDEEKKSTAWQDWALFGLRWVFLIFFALIILMPFQPDTFSYAALPLALAAGMNILLAVFILIPAAHIVLPGVIIIGDLAMTAGLVFISFRNNPQAPVDPVLLVAITGVIILSGLLRLGVLWGVVQSVGVLVAAVLTIYLVAGQQQFSQQINALTPSLLVIALLAVTTAVWSFVLYRQFKQQQDALEELHQNKVDQLSEMKEHTRAIYEMAETLSSTLNYDRILNAALQAGWMGLRESDRRGKEKLVSAVLLFRADDNQLHVVTGRGLSRTDEGRVTPGANGIIGQSLKQCVPIFGKIARKDPELQYFVAFQDVRSTLSIPLRAGFDNYGVLLYGSDKPNAFTEEHTELLMAIGSQATIALQNAVLYNNILDERDKIVEVEEDARKKLARDLHDGPTQNVAAIAMRMSIIYRMLEKAPEDVPAELKKVEELARRTTKEIRDMLFTLRPLVLENQGLEAALQQLAEKNKETHGQNVAVRVGRGVNEVLDANQQGVIFYIIEEAVGNARKHAEAELISVSLMRENDSIIVTIADNGVGFDLGSVDANYDQRGSLGMVNMRERTQLLEGTLRIDSAEGKGTTIQILVPIKGAHGSTVEERRVRRMEGSSTKLAAAALARIYDADAGL